MAKVKIESGRRSVTTKDVIAKKTRKLAVPVRDIDTLENIACGFRVGLVDANVGGEDVGSVTSGGGFGSPWILVSWRDKQIAIHAVELLRAHVAEVAPEDLKHFDEK